jgi:hypothetical protein
MIWTENITMVHFQTKSGHFTDSVHVHKQLMEVLCQYKTSRETIIKTNIFRLHLCRRMVIAALYELRHALIYHSINELIGHLQYVIWKRNITLTSASLTVTSHGNVYEMIA